MKSILRIINFAFLLAILSASFAQCSKPEDPTYKAAVVEFYRAKNHDADVNLRENLQNIEKLFVENLSVGTDGENVDIVLMPESVINSEVNPIDLPALGTESIPCDGSKSLLSQMSCWSKSYRKYMVFNIVEKTKCTPEIQQQNKDHRPCTSDGLTRYNTNVVFDRNGALISRYRKVNPYFEYLINTTLQPDYTIFETDFGVKFGVAICFDLLFKVPTQDLIDEYDITDVLFSTYWFSELPFLTANQIQQSWSYANNVNFLASGGNNPEQGTTGSGVFSGRAGAIIARMHGSPATEMYIVDVPKKVHTKADVEMTTEFEVRRSGVHHKLERLKGLKMLRDPTVDRYENKLIDRFGTFDEELCHRDICCKFNLDVNELEELDDHQFYHYRMVAYSGVRNYFDGYRTMSFKTCSIIACLDSQSLESCGHVFPEETELQNRFYFEALSIEASTRNHEKVLFMPNSVNHVYESLHASEFEFTAEEKSQYKHLNMKLRNATSDLLTFGVFAIDYNSGSVGNELAITVLIILLLIMVFGR